MVGDLIEIARNLGSESAPLPSVTPAEAGSIRPIDDLECKYFLRLNIADRPGVLAQIARILGEQHISIASVLQKDANPDAQTAES